jgi:DNA-binding cell septation regulator SpoVG
MLEVTRVILYKSVHNKKAVTMCAVVLADALRINDIALYKKKESGEYYLVMPSRQDVYKEVQTMNKGTQLRLPKNVMEEQEGRKSYEEYFFPLSKELYYAVLDAVKSEYEATLK